MACALDGDHGTGIAHVSDDGNASFHLLHRELDESALLGVRQAQVFAFGHRQGDRIGPVAYMEIEQLRTGFVIDAEIPPERRDGRVSEAAAENCHVDLSCHQPCGSS